MIVIFSGSSDFSDLSMVGLMTDCFGLFGISCALTIVFFSCILLNLFPRLYIYISLVRLLRKEFKQSIDTYKLIV